MNKLVEILAPAGSYEGMRAALNAGADAVYIGGGRFGARAYAENFNEEALISAIDEAHIRGKKLYLTVNTLLKEKEHKKELHQFLWAYYRRGLDAVIVQDAGVMSFIHRNFPELPIHASTQMTLTMAQGANLLKDYGVTRFVTARELSIEEITDIRKNTELEIETFVHGALCYCYSGQCLMSSMIGGRSGNRGRCAQPCRMPYRFYSEQTELSSVQGKYLLSPKDINTLAIVPELIEAGINSFKIEGRMKRPEYAAAVSVIYRKYVTLYYECGKEEYRRILQGRDYREDERLLQDIYNRGGFSTGYGKSYHGKGMMSLYRPNHSGVYVGTVTAAKGSRVTLRLKEEVNAGDILEIRAREEQGYEFTVGDAHSKEESIIINALQRPEAGEEKIFRGKGTSYKKPVIKQGDMIYRTRNLQLLEKLKEKYLDRDRKLSIEGCLKAIRDTPLSLTVRYKEIEVTAYGEAVEEARKQPMTKETLSAPVLKTGDTLYYFSHLTIELGDNIFVPVGRLNEIRRDALGLLQEKILRQYRREQKKGEESVCLLPGAAEKIPGLCIFVQTEEQLKEALEYQEVTELFADYTVFRYEIILEMARQARLRGKRFYLALPHIVRHKDYDILKQELSAIMKAHIVSGLLIKNYEEIALLRTLGCIEQEELILNYNMYTYNREAKNFFAELGITRFTAPVELNYHELKDLCIHDSDLTVYGYQPVMVSAQCLFENTRGCRRGRKEKTGRLIDRLGKCFYVQANCRGCYNIIYNSLVLSLLKQKEEVNKLLPKNLRMDFTFETREEMRKILTAYIAAFYHGEAGGDGPADYTTGHFKRGVE